MIYYPDGNPAENGLFITPQMIEESNLDGLGHEVHTMDGAIAIISDEMEALELIHTANMLKALRNKLLDHLGNLCGKCDGCVQYGGKCWAKELEDQVVRVPDWAKKAAGIPLDANLVCAIDDCCIRIYKNRDNQGISDIPAEIISAFHANKLCIGGLYERVLSGEIVYSEGDKQ